MPYASSFGFSVCGTSFFCTSVALECVFFLTTMSFAVVVMTYILAPALILLGGPFPDLGSAPLDHPHPFASSTAVLPSGYPVFLRADQSCFFICSSIVHDSSAYTSSSSFSILRTVLFFQTPIGFFMPLASFLDF